LRALAALHTGESQIIFTDRDDQDLRMLGAIRAQKECLQCHIVAEGALLGAFSYQLRELTPPEYSYGRQSTSQAPPISNPVED